MRASGPTSWTTTSCGRDGPGSSGSCTSTVRAVVAVAGVTAYRTAFGDRRARLGRQETAIGAAELWVVPNPSGLNAHATIATLAEAYREVAVAAGVLA